ncbi:hypothetical protein MS3_00008710 [Schistosoma haematobium]|uniref:Disease resistance R13L4/SHOC-2-like LRR domain-containing protein n=2 Tax=Schistosoma haematobium TaxID=6185 RepID=A0A922LFA2_SCHHA|nr:hypothetical protein MS3_00008710 [Schistosoma haematobium]KAH9581633.1 hypothetical protein MS3_00008710 [Schistosoma haematobium]CAH8616774.1 unnamed protein product [Schistosoma haematobium]CAH8624400.1 unnamed protein product [Schistosoma haematobium]
MVKSSVALLCKSTSALKRRKIYETSEKCLKQITHLYLNGKNLDELGQEIALCQCLTVLYLYDNKLKSIPEHLNLTQLTHLYLQNNRISRMGNLNSLEKLEKLFLSRNCISIIEGLEGLIRLQELRIDNQNLNPGESLVFDDRSLNSVANSLICLDVSGNKLDTLQDLSNLHALISLNVSNNSIRSIHDLSTSLNKWSNLKEFHIKGNPVMKTTRARDIIIVTAKRLEMLDNKAISEPNRQFLENWNQYKSFNLELSKCPMNKQITLGSKPELIDLSHQ